MVQVGRLDTRGVCFFEKRKGNVFRERKIGQNAAFALFLSETLALYESFTYLLAYVFGAVITCPDPGTPLYGYRACTTSIHAYGSACSFHCETGYLLNGSERLICTDSGSWTNQLPKCESRSPIDHLFNTDFIAGSFNVR